MELFNESSVALLQNVSLTISEGFIKPANMLAASTFGPAAAAAIRTQEVTEMPVVDSSPLLHNSSTLQLFLHHQLGPQRLAWSVLIPITIVYAVIFVTGIVGNLSTCLVIIRNPHLQTATNYYLFSLAVSDLVTLLLGLPNDLWVYWRQYPYIFGQSICSIRALVSEMTSNASVLTIVAFTVERYLAICHPLYKQKMSNLSRVIKINAVTWLVAFISAIPFAVLTTINYVDYPPGSGHYLEESAFCAMAAENNHRNMPLLLFSSCGFFVLPMSFILVLYIKIGLKLHKAKVSRVVSGSHAGGNGRNNSSRNILRLLVSVVVVFFVCWAPFHAQRLLFVYVDAEGWTASLRDVNEKLYYVAGCLYYISCTTNPILYNVMSRKYREAFKETLLCCNGTGNSRVYYRDSSSKYHCRSNSNGKATSVHRDSSRSKSIWRECSGRRATQHSGEATHNSLRVDARGTPVCYGLEIGFKSSSTKR